jgi:hypothetical protein
MENSSNKVVDFSDICILSCAKFCAYYGYIQIKLSVNVWTIFIEENKWTRLLRLTVDLRC